MPLESLVNAVENDEVVVHVSSWDKAVVQEEIIIAAVQRRMVSRRRVELWASVASSAVASTCTAPQKQRLQSAPSFSVGIQQLLAGRDVP